MEQGQLKRKISELNELRTQIKKEEAKLADYIRAKLLKTTHTIQWVRLQSGLHLQVTQMS